MKTTVNYKFKDGEMLAIYDTYTNKVKDIPRKPNNIPEGKEVFSKDAKFTKSYDKSWEFLTEVLTPKEFLVTKKLCLMANPSDNSLAPMNDESTLVYLAKEVSIHRNHVKKIFDKLFLLGIYGKFKISKPDVQYTNYWVVNPYLSIKTRIMFSDISTLFNNTIIHMAHRGDDKDLILAKCIKNGVKLP